MKSLKEKIITLGLFPYSRALLLQVQLQTEGIECFLVEKESQPSRSADLRVKQQDVARSMIIIDTAQKAAGLIKEKGSRGKGVIRRILVPVDFSVLSVHACRFAVSLAHQFKAEVKLLHVFYNPAIDITPYDENYTYQVKLSNNLREIEKNARVSLFKLEEKLKTWSQTEKLTGAKITCSLANGEAADEIINYCIKYRPALIIMGTRGLTKGTHVLGRVTTRVMDNANVPILALPSNSLNRFNELKNVVYATDFDPSDHAAIHRLLSLLAPLNIQLHCVHVSVGMKKPWDPVKMEELKESLVTEVTENKIMFNVVVSDNIIYGLETYMRNNDINAIALITHHKGVLERMFTSSHTRKIFSEIGKPLFVFHAR